MQSNFCSEKISIIHIFVQNSSLLHNKLKIFLVKNPDFLGIWIWCLTFECTYINYSFNFQNIWIFIRNHTVKSEIISALCVLHWLDWMTGKCLFQSVEYLAKYFGAWHISPPGFAFSTIGRNHFSEVSFLFIFFNFHTLVNNECFSYILWI